MIAELAAANAAFDVIKQTIQNGQEIYAAGEALAQYFGLKNEIQKKAHEHGYRSDLEAFMAEEKLREMEDELKQIMIWQGRGGMWNDWLTFQAQMKQSREEAAAAQKQAIKNRRKNLIATIEITAAILGGLAICGLGAFVLYQLIK